MTDIIKRNKPLSVNPLKASQTIGAALAFLGFNRAMPMLHGSQGCTAFGKVFFVRHFREPIPVQTTAMEQISTIMGAEENIIEGLKVLVEKHQPDLLGVVTTGLSETQGSDVDVAVKQFKQQYPKYHATQVVAVSTPDYKGCLETGFAKAVEAIIATQVPAKPDLAGFKNLPGLQSDKQVNVLVSASLTPGDIEALEDMMTAFGLQPVILPNIADSLDGHLIDDEFCTLTVGGTTVSDLSQLHQARATLVIGSSLHKAADKLNQLTQVPDYRFDHLMGLEAVDAFVHCLHQISDNPVPAKLERQRSQLLDAMLDCHFMIGMTKVAIAADPELLVAFSQFAMSMGAEVVAAVSSVNDEALQRSGLDTVKIGDLEDLELLAKQHHAELIISNSHAAETAKRLNKPLIRAGFPQYDVLGGYQKCWIGYQGSKHTLFELANQLLHLDRGEVQPYHSIFSQKGRTDGSTTPFTSRTAPI